MIRAIFDDKMLNFEIISKKFCQKIKPKKSKIFFGPMEQNQQQYFLQFYHILAKLTKIKAKNPENVNKNNANRSNIHKKN